VNRWLLGAAFVVVVGLLASLLVIAIALATRGIRVQLAEPIRISGPLTVGGNITVQDPVVVTMDAVEIRMPQPISVDLPADTLNVRATLGGAACAHCSGTLLPVRWNLFTGEIVWRCSACGKP